MARSRTGRRVHQGKIRSISEASAEPRKRMPIPPSTRDRILSVHQAQTQAMRSLKGEWEAFLSGLRTALGVPDGWVLDFEGGQLCFAEPAMSAVPAPEAPSAHAEVGVESAAG